MRKDEAFTRADLELLHRGLVFRRKRVREQVVVVRLQGLLDRVEGLLLQDPGRVSLRLSPPEQEILQREISLYCEDLTRRGGSLEGRREARRLESIVAGLTGVRIRRGRSAPWWRRLLGWR